MVETMGGGCGAVDFDRDGRIDFVLPQGGNSAAPGTLQPPRRTRLFRQVADKVFEPVEGSALPEVPHRYGQGVAVGDYNGDGFGDVYITNVGENQLFCNNGDGTFSAVELPAALRTPAWSSSSAFADLDADGLLDLYVCNYVDYDPQDPIDCRNDAGEPRICHPRSVPGVPDVCLMNQGDGTFVNEASQRGLVGEGSKGLGVAILDLNHDGASDLYVANDTTGNYLFMNQGNGRFEDQALLLGCAMNRAGLYQASMGIGVGDYDRDGWTDLYSTHFYDESNTLYRNLGPVGFQDTTAIVDLHQPTLPYLAFGNALEDFDQNGAIDLFIANGHIENYPENELHEMQPQIFTFNGRRFVDASKQAGAYFQRKYVGRGVCINDFNRDGAVDLVVVHQDAPLALLENRAPKHRWLTVDLVGRRSNRDGIGARVTVRVGGDVWTQHLYGGGSYASSRQPSLFFGLGAASGKAEVEVVWPSGVEQTLPDVPLDQAIMIEETPATASDPPAAPAGT